MKISLIVKMVLGMFHMYYSKIPLYIDGLYVSVLTCLKDVMAVWIVWTNLMKLIVKKLFLIQLTSKLTQPFPWRQVVTFSFFKYTISNLLR
jgi:hypothetical protein